MLRLQDECVSGIFCQEQTDLFYMVNLSSMHEACVLARGSGVMWPYASMGAWVFLQKPTLQASILP